MRRILTVLAVAAALLFPLAAPAYAGSAHFVDDTVTAVRSGDTLTVSGKVAGLGDEPQVHIIVTATASCINPGSNKPKAANKMTISAEGDFPVQNGKALFSLTLTPVLDPSSPCPDPMVIEWSDVRVADTTSGISTSLPGTF